MTRFGLLLMLVLGVAAAAAASGCSDSAGTGADAAPATADTGAGDVTAGDDGAVASDSGVDAPAIAACTARLSFRTAGSVVPHGIDHHATFIGNADGSGTPTLFVAGGNDYSSAPIKREVYRATIMADGSLGPFEATTALPGSGLAGSGVVVRGARVYLVGGRTPIIDGPVLSAEIKADGTLGAWKTEAARLPEGRFHLSSALHGDHLFAIGGLGPDSYARDTVFVADIAADGSVGSFRSAGTLPAARSHHGSFVYGDYLYLSGGFAGTPLNNQPQNHLDVIRAPIGSDGKLGTFEKVGDLVANLSTHAQTRVGDCVFLFGGLNLTGANASYNASALRASLASPSTVKLESANATAPEGRSHMHHVPYWRGHFYLVGGSKAYQDVTGGVMIGDLAP
ncbi:MAG: hypothetical protein KC503_16710 [Myxococcales bacterium]|nr:hypothetical protein [Myxococcales bacterium]